jgi:hypothetical protein
MTVALCARSANSRARLFVRTGLLGMVAVLIVAATGCSGGGRVTYPVYFSAPTNGPANTVVVATIATCPWVLPTGFIANADWYDQNAGAFTPVPPVAAVPTCPNLNYNFGGSPILGSQSQGTTEVRFTGGPATLQNLAAFAPLTITFSGVNGAICAVGPISATAQPRNCSGDFSQAVARRVHSLSRRQSLPLAYGTGNGPNFQSAVQRQPSPSDTQSYQLAYGITIEFSYSLSNLTVTAQNDSGSSVPYADLAIATGASIQYFSNEQFVEGLSSGQQVAQIPSSGSLSPGSTTLASFTPSSSPSVYDGGTINLNGDAVNYALGVQPSIFATPTLPEWGAIGMGLALICIAVWRLTRGRAFKPAALG